MAFLSRKTFSKDEEQLLVEAIKDAERGNRGEVCVHIETHCKADALERAAEMFHQLGMAETEESTGVLLYVASKSRKAAVFAGSGIHPAAEESFWAGVVEGVTVGFAKRAPLDGLTSALEKIGALLRDSVPGEDKAGNELPDRVTQS